MWGGEFGAIGFVSLSDPETVIPIVTEPWDVENFTESGSHRLWVVNERGRSTLRLAREGLEPETLETPKGVISSLLLPPARPAAAVLILEAATRPAEIAVIDLKTGDLRYLTDSRPPGLLKIAPVEPQVVNYPSENGRRIDALLYRPPGDGPFPVAMMVHGGPHGQERPDYTRSGLYQFLTTRRIALFSPQMSGSSSYGTSFQRSIYRDWGGIDLEDFAAALCYLQSTDWADPRRVAVAGGSYGGFAALSCLSRLDHPWAAGVSLYGPANLVTFARNCPPTWRSFVDTVLGNPDRDADFLRERSPITYADQITSPLFVIQGAMDPRVPQNEADQIVTEVRASGTPVRYDIYPDEGHGFTRRDNEIQAYTDLSSFLIDHLTAAKSAQPTTSRRSPVSLFHPRVTS
ncbi:alpha/beta hydrolase family protein [Actinocorallia longicatena]|uniref:Peptidase S9 prolyl oligopeptidase catalytic domain-containing protein n=1 Tax=Actinocorallia longicatena TaxID=111803 RepID=A0ABP6QP23_9ACTN